MNSLFTPFGLFEWILVGCLAGLTMYLFYFCYCSGETKRLKKSLHLICAVTVLFYAVFHCGNNRLVSNRSISYDAINPYFTASFASQNETNSSLFSQVSVSRDRLFRKVASPKTVQDTGTANSSRYGSENLSHHEGVPQSAGSVQPGPTARGVVSAELTTTVTESSDPIRQASFQSQSVPASVPKLETSNSLDPQLPFAQLSQNEIARRLEKAKLASVQIEAKIHKAGSKGIREAEETGSGFIIMTRPGNFYVLTNNHVAGNPVSNEQVNIILNDKRQVHPKRVVSSEEFDLAVLELDKQDILPSSLQNADSQTLNDLFHSSDNSFSWYPATLGNSDQVRVTESVWVIGCPFGLEGSVTKGIVSGLDRHRIPLGTENQIQGFIQTDASVNPGNSGGPLVNDRGEVIGVMIAIASKTGESSGVSFAIPINNAIHVAEQLIRDGIYQRPYIGVKLDRLFDASKKIQSGLLLDSVSIAGSAKRAAGTRVTSVVPGSPAAQAGLREGDIILRYNDKTIEDEQHFEYMISLSRINEVPKIEILRDGHRYVISPKLTDKNLMKAQNVSIGQDY